MKQELKPPSARSLLAAELLGTAAGEDEMSITRDLIAVARDRAAHTQLENDPDLDEIPRSIPRSPV